MTRSTPIYLLLDFGSRVRYYTYLRVSPDRDVPSLSQKLRQGFAALAPDQPRIRVWDSRDVSQSLSRVTGHFTGYMAVVSLMALFLAGIAAAYLFRGFLGGKHREIAVLMSLGAVLVAGSVATGIIFTAGFALAFLVFAGAGWLGAIGCRHLVRKMVFLNLYRNICLSFRIFQLDFLKNYELPRFQ
ncbi:MAG: hypothetical protein R6V54_14375 [Desulfobacteraceae bacterium]